MQTCGVSPAALRTLALLAWLLLTIAFLPNMPFAPRGCIVIVHLGTGEPVGSVKLQISQIADNVQQVRLFSKTISIFLVVQRDVEMTQQDRSKINGANVHIVYTNELRPTMEHQAWLDASPLARNTERANFWRYTSERFYYLSDLAAQKSLKNVIHIVSKSLLACATKRSNFRSVLQEYDNLVYMDVEKLLPVLEKFYSVAAVFDSPGRAIPSRFNEKPECRAFFQTHLHLILPHTYFQHGPNFRFHVFQDGHRYQPPFALHER
ncbi:MAG: hypothetical protein J3K34DRAFT_182928 [Monoraphidium minutum]|nr:MAG: hypothetical protein J3K34DRAFT_182928 [Monoraphidium minutum]